MSVSNDTTTKPNDKVISRYLAEGTLVLQSAAHFGSGEEGPDTDLAIMRDAAGTPVIPGSSLAGACRSYLTYYLLGKKAFFYLGDEQIPTLQVDREKKERELRSQELHSQEGRLIGQLFGDWQFRELEEAKPNGKKAGGEQKASGQSTLIVYDAYPGKEVKPIKKDGVAIQAATGQAQKGAKYDLEIIEPGTEFLLRFELVIRQDHNAPELKNLLGILLTAFEAGEIRLGAKTSRGLGRGKVADWKIHDWDFTQNPAYILDWLRATPPSTTRPITPALSAGKQSYLDIEAVFELDSSLLVRSYVDENDQPDAVQLNLPQANGRKAPLIPGSSAAGLLRHRAERIVRTLGADPEKAVIWPLFGIAGGNGDKKKNPEATKQEKEKERYQRVSRLRIEEEWLTGEAISEVQSRIQIDRLTGGVMPGALFDEKPVWGKNLQWKLCCRVYEPKDYELGLLLHLIKDMWLGDLTVGGGAGIGRGVLRGKSAKIIWQKEAKEEWSFRQADDRLVFEPASTPQALNKFAASLKEELTKNG